MRDSTKKHRIKKETTDAKKQEFELDNNRKIETIDEQLDKLADIIVELLLKENYDNENL